MRMSEEIVQLKAEDDTSRKVLDIMGWKVRQQHTHWDADDTDTDYHFDYGDADSGTIGFLGDDAIGACVGLFNMKEDDTKLVGIFCFGDEGRTEILICDKTRDRFVRINDL